MFPRSNKMLRTPPQQSQGNTNESQQATSSHIAEESTYICEVCLVTDISDKVCCDGCNKWSHFDCVGVTGEIANQDWFCNNCLEGNKSNTTERVDVSPATDTSNLTNLDINATNLDSVQSNLTVEGNENPSNLESANTVTIAERSSAKTRSHHSGSTKSTSSSLSRRQALALEKLEEERQLKQLRDQEEKERRDAELRKRAQDDADYLNRKYQILGDESDSSVNYDDNDQQDFLNTSRQDDVQHWLRTHSRLKKVCKWADELPEDKEGAIGPSMSSTKVLPQKDDNVMNDLDEAVPASTFPVTNPVPVPLSRSTLQVDVRSKQNETQQNQPPGGPEQLRQPLNGPTQSQPSTGLTRNQPSSGLSRNQPSKGPVHNQPTSGQQLNQPFNGPSNNQNVCNQPPSGLKQSRMSTNQAPVASTYPQTSSHGAIRNQSGTNMPVNSSVASNIVPQDPTHHSTFVVTSTNDTHLAVDNHPTTISQQQHSSWSQHQSIPTHPPIMASLPHISSTHVTTSVDNTTGRTGRADHTHHPSSINGPTPVDHTLPVSNYAQISTSQTQTISTPSGTSIPVTRYIQSSSNRTFVNSAYGPVYRPASYSIPMSGSPGQNVTTTSNMSGNNNSTSSTSHAQTYGGNSSYSQPSSGVTRHLTMEQIAARQACKRDLPLFYGDSEDWLTFISAYENTTSMCGYSHQENLRRLQDAVKGDAKEAVESLWTHADSVPVIINTLFTLFGRPEYVIEAKKQSVHKEPAPKEDDLSSLMMFGIKVRNLSETIQNTGLVQHLNDPSLINGIVDKLPTKIKLDWASYQQNYGATDLAALGHFMGSVVEAVSLVVRTSYKSNARKDKDKKNSKNHVNVQVETQNQNLNQSGSDKAKKCPACKNVSCTKIANCNKFKELGRSERSFIVKENKLCTRCLGGHSFFRCKSKAACKVSGCNVKHHTLLHNPERTSSSNTVELTKPNEAPKDNAKNGSTSITKFSSNATHTNVMSNRNDRTDIFRIVPVNVSYKGKTIKVYAFIDDGSNMTTMESSLAEELKLMGSSAPICVDWAFGHTHTLDSKIVSVKISGQFDNAEQFDVDNIRTVKELHLPTQSITRQWLNQYSHLKSLPIVTYEDVKPRILIGLQYSRLSVSLKTVEGNYNEPVACKTRLGWIVQGPSYDSSHSSVNRKFSINMCHCQSNDIDLHQLVKEYFFNENLGVTVPTKMLESADIQRARQIMESTTKKVNGRFETGLLWKFNKMNLPDTYPMALKRLQCLEAKMAKDPKIAANLKLQFQQFVDKGYIRKLRPNEIEAPNGSPVWYLPTFPAFNPKKPEKVRIVWDAAAKVKNVSLNSMLLTGPDQLVPLPDILRRYREKLFSILGDIVEMYHQVKVIQKDQNAQRMLWRDGDPTVEPDIYVMEVLPFGLACSPSLAQHVKNKNATEFADEYPEAVNTIINNHYVDDMLDCEHTIEAAEKRINEVRYIHSQGGFRIRNFMSNSKELLQRIGETTDQQCKNMNITIELSTERVLGMFWNAATDCFTFSLKYNKITEKIKSCEQRPTKREVMQILMSVFDPLGLLANYLVYAKILIQEMWRSNVDWDEEITSPIFTKWCEWIKVLPGVENIQVPRLYSSKLSPKTPKSIQLHVFVDASIEAYATAIYFRIEDDEGVDCCLVGAKTKVAPNKPMSVPRLELQGGVLGTRLASSIKSSQTFKIDKQVFWTDSQDVMAWVNSEARKYKQFVAFRIAEILDASDQKEWRWLPSEQNVADEATKSKKVAKLESNSRWYKAPSFLYEREETWFRDEGEIKFFTEEEIRPSFSMACKEIVRPTVIDIERFSQWSRLLRAVAYMLRFIHNVRHVPSERRTGPFQQCELQNAENHLYRQAQTDCFMDEIAIMKENRSSKYPKELEKSSILRTFSPYMDKSDVIRMKGRIDAATAVSYDTKRPIILPRRHRITKLIVDHYHRLYKHVNHSTAINEIRQKYVIPALRVVMKGIRTSCQKCKNLSAEPKIPEMAELPPARLATHTLPFTFVGVDYFGPLRVRNGRKTRNRPVIMEKRWILLFTCLTTRAIWMEISHSLDTNSCIMSINNFIRRKGQPRMIYSDNGSSFHSSEKELIDEFKKMDQQLVEEKFTNSDMVWRFNPPATPHMGGVWERMIRTVKTCLKDTLKTRTPNDEMLKNLIVEAEFIVNSRPLTYVSLESADDEALTPNHILLGSSNGSKPMFNVTEKDLSRNTYKAVQVLANNFWRRFVLEYMPTLTKRTKWFKKVDPIKVGNVVLVIDENNERNTWPKGIVVELLPAKSGIVRQVLVRTASGIRRRSVGKLAVLDVKPIEDEVKQPGAVNEEENVGEQMKRQH